MSKVYLLRTTGKDKDSLTAAGQKIFQIFSDQVKAKTKETVLTDCTVLYKGDRSFASSHLQLAKNQGFDFADIIIADGEKGREEMKVPVNLKHFQEVRLGAGLKDYNFLLAITHFTGHGMAGIGGALKNIGMGLGTKGGKMDMHQHFDLEVNADLCTGCGTCARECAGGAISVVDGLARIDKNKCLHCALCISICPVGAVQRPFGAASAGTSRDLQERIVEYAFGALKDRKSYFVSALLDITPHCDCLREGFKDPVVQDIGILASDDIVSIDQASLDLTGKNHFTTPDMNPQNQIDYAAQIGLGEKKYELVEI